MKTIEKILSVLFLAVIVSTNLFAAGNSEKKEGLTIVASTSIVGDVAKSVVGNKHEVIVIIPQGGNPHNYEPSPRDMAVVEEADLIFVNGMGLEETLLESMENIATGLIVEVSSTIEVLSFDNVDSHDDHHDEDVDHDDDHHDEDMDHDEEHHHHDGDPHTWTSPLNVMKWVVEINNALIEIDPENSEYYSENSDKYTKKLIELDKNIREQLNTIPNEERQIVSDHRIFGYFAKDYGFEIMGAIIPSFSTNSEISAKDLTELIDLVDDHNIRAIFIGNTAGEALKKMAEVLIEETEHTVSLYPILTGSLTAEGQKGDSYIGFMEYNVEQIVKGLGK